MGYLRTLVHALTDIEFVIKPVLNFSTVLERTGAIIGEESATKWPATEGARLQDRNGLHLFDHVRNLYSDLPLVVVGKVVPTLIEGLACDKIHHKISPCGKILRLVLNLE